MGLLSFFQRNQTSAEAPAANGRGRKRAGNAAASADAVQAARTRARQRLIGAFVLLLIGVIGFPLLFETQPRPIPVDLPIEVPRKDAVPALALPPMRSEAAPASTAAAPAPVVAKAEPAVITETPAEAGREVAPPAPSESPASKPAGKREEKPAAKPHEDTRAAEKKPADKPVSAAAAASKPAPADGARAKALLEGGSAAEAGRFVVQVGAFADNQAVRETRQKVEKLGLKTYTQVVETDGGKRTRVRIGPFSSREEASQAAAKLKSAGLGGSVLTL